MRGVVFLGERQLEVRSFPDPTPGPGEVVLAIKASGMCGSDLKFYRPSRAESTQALGLGGDGEPNIAGHEPCGVVVARGAGVSASQAPDGARVMVHHYKGCGHCEHCHVGWQQLCRSGIVVYGATGDGAHADYMKVPVSTLVPLPDELSFETGAAISCGTGTAWGALERVGLTGADTIAIFGQGPVGLSATQFAHARGARVIAIDTSPERLALARELGADALINAASDDPVAAIMELTHGRGSDKGLDCSGAEAGRLGAIRSAKTWGVVGMVGEGGQMTIDVSKEMLRRQLTIIGSWTFSSLGQAQCARYVAERGIDVDHLFTDRYRELDEARAAYEKFDRQTSGKGVFLL
ncbi:MAG: zinc-binding dehydrogenase [Burkholderiaceae bacterium]